MSIDVIWAILFVPLGTWKAVELWMRFGDWIYYKYIGPRLFPSLYARRNKEPKP